jgi:hypothetical protein
MTEISRAVSDCARAIDSLASVIQGMARTLAEIREDLKARPVLAVQPVQPGKIIGYLGGQISGKRG